MTLVHVDDTTFRQRHYTIPNKFKFKFVMHMDWLSLLALSC